MRGIKNQGNSEISMKYGKRDNTEFFDGDAKHWIGGVDENEMLFPVDKFVTQLEVQYKTDFSTYSELRGLAFSFDDDSIQCVGVNCNDSVDSTDVFLFSSDKPFLGLYTQKEDSNGTYDVAVIQGNIDSESTSDVILDESEEGGVSETV